MFQVDERMAPRGSSDRNETQLRSLFLDVVRQPGDHTHLVRVGQGRDAELVAREYAATLRESTGGELDVVHLGLGDDGHTASLVPGDALLGETSLLVGATSPYRGFRRVSLTYPALAAARHVAWFVVGASKAGPVEKLLVSDPSIPAGRVAARNEMIFTDVAANPGSSRS